MCTNKPKGKKLPSLPRYGERYIAARKCSIHHKNNLHKNLNYFVNSNLSSMLKLTQINAET